MLGALALAGCCLGGPAGPPGSLSLAPGFAPDPTTMRGSAGAELDAASFGPGCIGHVSRTPDHVLALEAPMPYLRIVARAAEDVTLVVRRPDGSFLCNDDHQGRDPMVEGELEAGSYQIYVGSYSVEARATPYTIAFTTDRALEPSALPAP